MYEVSHFLAQFLDNVPYITIEQLHLVLINFKISMPLQEALNDENWMILGMRYKNQITFSTTQYEYFEYYSL